MRYLLFIATLAAAPAVAEGPDPLECVAFLNQQAAAMDAGQALAAASAKLRELDATRAIETDLAFRLSQIYNDLLDASRALWFHLDGADEGPFSTCFKMP